MSLAPRIALWLALGVGILAVPLFGLGSQLRTDAVVEHVRAAASETLGRPVYAAGGGTVAWGGEVRVALRGVSIPRQPGAADPALITAQSIEVGVALLPLVWGETRLKRIEIRGPRLIVDGDLRSLAGWQPHKDGSSPPEIVLVDGTAEVTARLNGQSYRLVLDHLSGTKRADDAFQVRAAGAGFAFEGTMTATATGQRFAADRLVIGDSELAGEVLIEPRCDRPRLTANLRSQHIRLDEWAAFMPVLDEDIFAGSFDGAGGSDPLPSLDGLTEIDLDLNVKADRADWAGQAFADARAAMTLSNGRLSISSLRARAGDGSFALSAVVDRYEAAHSLALNANELVLAEFGAAAAGSRRQTRLNIDLELSGEGKSWRALLESLSGRARMTLANADMRPPESELIDVVMPWVRRAGVLNIDRLQADLSIDEGRISTNRVAVETPRVAMAADGVIDFSERSLHVELTPTAKDPEIADQSVPLMVTGPLADPAVLPNPVTPNVAVEPEAADTQDEESSAAQ